MSRETTTAPAHAAAVLVAEVTTFPDGALTTGRVTSTEILPASPEATLMARDAGEQAAGWNATE